MKVESREYKLLIEHAPFADPGTAVEAVWSEIEQALETLPGVRTSGRCDQQETRTVDFLDTPDHTLRQAGLVLRRRVGEQVEYTLKCRSEDRYFVAGTDVSAAERWQSKRKLEEDIAPPFRCRFSHSARVVGPSGKKKQPTALVEVAVLFPLLGTLTANGRLCHPETALVVVNNLVVEETVWKGGKILFAQRGADAEKAQVALILWAHGRQNRPVIAELSFRIEDSEERFSRELAQAARAVYRLLQRLDCARSGGITKTEYVYRDGARD